jgi:hypothetical protein
VGLRYTVVKGVREQAGHLPKPTVAGGLRYCLAAWDGLIEVFLFVHVIDIKGENIRFTPYIFASHGWLPGSVIALTSQ